MIFRVLGGLLSLVLALIAGVFLFTGPRPQVGMALWMGFLSFLFGRYALGGPQGFGQGSLAKYGRRLGRGQALGLILAARALWVGWMVSRF